MRRKYMYMGDWEHRRGKMTKQVGQITNAVLFRAAVRSKVKMVVFLLSSRR